MDGYKSISNGLKGLQKETQIGVSELMPIITNASGNKFFYSASQPMSLVYVLSSVSSENNN